MKKPENISTKETEELIASLSPLEKKVLSNISLDYNTLKEKTGLDDTALLRTLKFLESKKIISLKIDKSDIADLGVNGVYYKKNHLPERNLLSLLDKKSPLDIEEAQKLSGLSENEFKVSLGVLKGKALISLANGKIVLNASKEEIMKKSLEEQLIEVLPKPIASLPSELLHALENLKKRKQIVEINEYRNISYELTPIGKGIIGKDMELDLIEEVTPEIISNWQKGKKFRRYDINAPVPSILGGRRHFVNRTIEQGRKVWLELGFKEMTGSHVVSSFWNFDALFTAQDHPVREIHDTFFIKDATARLPNENLVENVRKAHESGVSGSKGWQYLWNEKTAQRVLMRTHTTCLSAQTLSHLKEEELPAKYFAIGKCFRNETIDWKHGFEFNQTEGIVIDQNANFLNLLGYLKEFARKMGFNKVKFQPSYFPYTEPCVEGLVWHEERKEWIEVFAAGIFRPEVTVPLLGKAIPVLAWGPGFDRLMMMACNIKDMRDLYANDIKMLREVTFRKE